MEAQELVILLDFEKVDILQTFLHREWLQNFAIYGTAFKVEFADFFFDVKEEVAHQEDVYLLDVFHFYGVDAVNLCN